MWGGWIAKLTFEPWLNHYDLKLVVTDSFVPQKFVWGGQHLNFWLNQWCDIED